MAAALNHLRRGSGEPLILIHTLGGSLVMWSPVLDRLAAEHEVIAVDLPGFGGSPPLPAGVEPSAATLARAVIELHDELALEGDPHVAGISLGGWVAIECGRRGRARSVTGICPAGFWRDPLGPRRNHARTAARVLLPLAPALLRSERGRRLALSGQMRHPERVSPAQAATMVCNYARSPAYPRANELMRAGVVEGLEGIEAPITLAWAEHDTLVRRRPLGALPDRVRQVVLLGCGHLPTWDDPERVAGVILETTGARTPATPAAASAE
jgi:pimeloyl-ACP methyl ester carboxylesterase